MNSELAGVLALFEDRYTDEALVAFDALDAGSLSTPLDARIARKTSRLVTRVRTGRARGCNYPSQWDAIVGSRGIRLYPHRIAPRRHSMRATIGVVSIPVALGVLAWLLRDHTLVWFGVGLATIGALLWLAHDVHAEHASWPDGPSPAVLFDTDLIYLRRVLSDHPVWSDEPDIFALVHRWVRSAPLDEALADWVIRSTRVLRALRDVPEQRLSRTERQALTLIADDLNRLRDVLGFDDAIAGVRAADIMDEYALADERASAVADYLEASAHHVRA